MEASPILQVALDFVDLSRALRLAEETVRGGADWLEAGTPLIKSEGLDAVRKLRERFPNLPVVADMKTMDVGRAEMEMAAKAGATAATVLGVASDSTIRECIEAGINYGLQIGVDLARVADPVQRAMEVEEWGAAFVCVHAHVDEQMQGGLSFGPLKEVAAAVEIPVAAAGGINSETAPEAAAAGARIIIVGGAVTKAEDAERAVRIIKEALTSGKAIETDLFKRVDAEGVREVFLKVSTSNISDGSHRSPCVVGLKPITPGSKLVGRAVTVRTYPGDWAKPVEAIDIAEEGDCIVIDAGGVGPALWGELATHSAIRRKLAGVVIDGAVRDTPEIRKAGFPAFARLVMSNAGEPKGFGEIGVPVRIGGVQVHPGDWIIGDDDGVMVIPQSKAAEMANRALDCLEKEIRWREEIKTENSTLGKVLELRKWEKK